MGLGLKFVNRNPGLSRWTVNPYIYHDLGWVNMLIDESLPVLYVNAGYAFDTDFCSSGRGQFSYGAGVRLWHLPRFMVFGGYVQYTAGYNAFARTPNLNYWHFGVRIRLNKPFVYLIY